MYYGLKSGKKDEWDKRRIWEYFFVDINDI